MEVPMKLLPAAGTIAALILLAAPASAQTPWVVLPAKLALKGWIESPGGVSPASRKTATFIRDLAPIFGTGPTPKEWILALLVKCQAPADVQFDLIAWNKETETPGLSRYAWTAPDVGPGSKTELLPDVYKAQEVVSGRATRGPTSLYTVGRIGWGKLPKGLNNATICPVKFKSTSLHGVFGGGPTLTIYTKGKLKAGKPIALLELF
jgi:hypothetical protein